MGIGTGGLHARYALAKMAKSVPVVNSETRLLITHDAPHRGANIALGLQHLSRMLGNFNYFGVTAAVVFPEYAETVAFLDAPINVETLLYRATTDKLNSPNTFMNATYRTMVDFAPGTQPYQFVPTSLGNECAAPLFTAGRLFMNFGLGTGTGLKAKLSVFGITIPLSIPISDLKYDCAVYASSIPPANESERKVAELKTVFKFVLFGFIQVAKSGYDEKAEASNTYLAVDGVPGSFNTILDFNELRNFNSAVGNWSFSESEYLFSIPLAKFVKLKFYAFVKAYAYNSGVFTTQYTSLPVGSALDVDPFNSSTFTQKFVNGSNPAFLSKGNTYIAQETNTSQSLYNNASMRFTARNARFLFNEMELLPNSENCSPECSNPFAIAGNSPVCSSDIFWIPGIQRGTSITWNVSPANGIVNFLPNGQQVTLTKINNGTVTLTATFTTCGVASSVSRVITIGIPVVGSNNPPLQLWNGSTSSYNNVCNLQTTYTNMPVWGASSISWTRTAANPTNTSWSQSGNNVNFYFWAVGQTAVFRLQASNACGSVINSYGFTAISCGGGGGGGCGSRYKVSPNPANGYTAVTVVNIPPPCDVKTITQAEQDALTIKSVRIYDNKGVIKKTAKVKALKKYELLLPELKTGVYFIEISDGFYTEKQQLIITK